MIRRFNFKINDTHVLKVVNQKRQEISKIKKKYWGKIFKIVRDYVKY